MISTTTIFKRVLIFGALVWGLIQTSRVEAQTPCTGSNAYGCGGRYGYGGDVTDVTIKNSAGTILASYSGLGCNNATSYRGIQNSGNAFDLVAGDEVTIEITGTSWTTIAGYDTRVGVWMDVSLNNSFERDECVINPQTSSVGTTMQSFKVKVPCYTKAGSSFLRVRGGSFLGTAPSTNNGCGNVNTYGNVIDFAVNYK